MPPLAPGPIAPPEKPSSSLWGGILRSLFPAGQYEGVVPPDVLREERNQALRRAGLSLMASGSSWHPANQPTAGFAGDLAEALNPDQWSQRIAGVAERAQQIQAVQAKAERNAQVDHILHQFSAQPGETDVARDDRLSKLADAFQSAGLMEEAKQAADLRTSLRSPELGVHGDVLYDKRTGRVVGQFPAALQTPEGAALHSQSITQLKPFDAVRRSVEQYNLYRNAPLNSASSQGLLQAAQDLMSTSKGLAEGTAESAINHVPVLGEVAKLLQALMGKSESLTEADRQRIIKAVDPLIDNILAPEHARVMADVRRIYVAKYGEQGADEMLKFLPASPNFNHLGVTAVQSKLVRDMDNDSLP